MAKKAKAKMGKKAKGLLIGIGAVVAVAFTIGTTVRLNKLDKTDEVSATFGYEQGLLGADGSETKGTTAIRTKKFVSVEGLTCDLVSEASITYKIFYYDKDEEFISATDELSADYVAGDNLPEGAEYARVVITPVNDPEVSLTEIATYARELTVSWEK